MYCGKLELIFVITCVGGKKMQQVGGVKPALLGAGEEVKCSRYITDALISQELFNSENLFSSPTSTPTPFSHIITESSIDPEHMTRLTTKQVI